MTDTAERRESIAPVIAMAPLRKTQPRSLSVRPPLDVEAILLEVCIQYRVTRAELVGKQRDGEYVRPRHVAAWLLRQTGRSYPQIGRTLGGRDHTSAMYAVRRIEGAIRAEPGLRGLLEAMLAQREPVVSVPGLGVVIADGEAWAGPIELDNQLTATGSNAGDTSSSASSALNHEDGSRA